MIGVDHEDASRPARPDPNRLPSPDWARNTRWVSCETPGTAPPPPEPAPARAMLAGAGSVSGVSGVPRRGRWPIRRCCPSPRESLFSHACMPAGTAESSSSGRRCLPRPLWSRRLRTLNEPRWPYWHEYYTSKVFKVAVRRAQLPLSTTTHDLRHHFASVLLAAGESVIAVAERLGHEDAALVLTTYGHLIPGADDRTRKAIDAAWTAEVELADEAVTAPGRPG